MRSLLHPSIGGLLLAVVAAEAEAQRALTWDELAVEARLDADGRLHVKETQVMVLSGDWNGGEHRFALKADQDLELHRITRVDPATGASWPLRQGSLDVVDQYDWSDATTLRWRSRSPSDPPFRDSHLTYVLEYTYTNVLQPKGNDQYQLDHDFAFAQRPGVIRRFSLDLTLDPVWAPLGQVPTGIVVADLPPGRGYVWKVGLSFRGDGRPAGVAELDVWGLRITTAAWTALFVVPLLVLGNAWWRERRAGRLDPIPAVSREWLEQNFRSIPAEVIGAAWDEQVGAPEVAAVIARLQAEGRIESHVGRAQRVGRPEMTLVLKAPLRDFQGYEHDLLRALFLGGTSDKTSTQAIREHYQSEGFDPAAIIRPHVQKAAEGFVARDHLPKPSWLPGTLLFCGGAALIAWGGLPQNPVWIPAVIGLLFVWVIGHAAASAWRRRVDRGLPAVVPVVLLAAVPLTVACALLRFGGMPGWRSLTHAGAVAVGLSVFVSVINAARSRRGPLSIRLRKRLCGLRRVFIDELSKPAPALEDAWFPYAVAFGLEKRVQRWFGRFGAAASPSPSSPHDSSWSSAGASSSPSSGSSTWTGGGGAFGGAGATGSWTAAVGSLAAGVSAPSSGNGGGGGGGGGGGSSSGGGGGGGW